MNPLSGYGEKSGANAVEQGSGGSETTGLGNSAQVRGERDVECLAAGTAGRAGKAGRGPVEHQGRSAAGGETRARRRAGAT